jgi:hypothetical protein
MLSRHLLCAAILTAGLCVLFVPSAIACTRYELTAEQRFTVGGFNLGSLSPGTVLDGTEADGVAVGFRIVIGAGQGSAETAQDLRARCVQSYDRRFDETPRRAGDVAVGSYSALAGVAIPNSVACPGDLLVVFVSTPLFFPSQFLPACLASLPSVVFQSAEVTLSADLGEGDEDIIPIFRLPFIIAYPVAYFVALIPSGAPITTAPADIAATVCVPTTDGAGRLIIPCTAL